MVRKLTSSNTDEHHQSSSYGRYDFIIDCSNLSEDMSTRKPVLRSLTCHRGRAHALHDGTHLAGANWTWSRIPRLYRAVSPSWWTRKTRSREGGGAGEKACATGRELGKTSAHILPSAVIVWPSDLRCEPLAASVSPVDILSDGVRRPRNQHGRHSARIVLGSCTSSRSGHSPSPRLGPSHPPSYPIDVQELRRAG